ncbi:MAG TPA: efflux RND transporter permease subunit [Gemmataceae bacterium]|jgi:multidrug efflux pump subunit AcrB|nr:efflux RND transporter permease subunit [Gemmataceae bacterium]
MWLVRAALSNFHAVFVFMMLIVVLGTVALMGIAVDILPSFNAPAVQVMTFYNGMPARATERVITDRIERWTNQSPGIQQVESRTLTGISIVKLYFRDDIDSTAALTMTNSLALSTLPSLPPNTLPPVVIPFDPTGTLPLGIITVSNPNLSEATVKDVARIPVRNALGRVRGAIAPVVVGGKDRGIMIYLEPKKMEIRGLAPTDVVRALDEGNFIASPGSVYIGDDQIALDTNVLLPEVDDFNELPIRFGRDEQVLLRDIGHAEDAYYIQKSRVRINGRRQVYVPVYRQQKASSLAVAEGVQKELPIIEKTELPEGSKLEFVMDQTIAVRKAIDSLIHEGVIGAILVALMILVFLGEWRMTVIAVIVLPLAVLFGIVGLRVSNQTINVMTLSGLFLAIGPLVDNAIVVLENTHRHIGLGKNPFRAAFDAASEVSLPVMVATLSTMIVLAPIALTPGLGGFLFTPLALAVAFSMAASYLLAFTVVPALCSRMLKGHNQESLAERTEHEVDLAADTLPIPADTGAGYVSESLHKSGPRQSLIGRVNARVQAALTMLTKRYEALLRVAMGRRGFVLGGAAALLVGSLLLIPGIGQEFFPQSDAGQITVLVRCPSNLRLDAAEERVAVLESFINEQIPEAERQTMVSEIGLNPDWSSAYTPNGGQQDAAIRIQLTESRSKTAQAYAIQLRHAIQEDPRFVDLDVAFDTGGMVSAALNYGASSPIDIQIDGGSTEERAKTAQRIRKRVADVRGAADVRIVQRNDAPYMILKVNRQEAARVGLSARDVALQVVTAMNSSLALTRNFWIDPATGNQYYVCVQYPEDPNFRLDDLKNVYATGVRQTQPVKLSSLVEIESRPNAVELNHVNLRRVTNVLVNTEGRDIGAVASDITKALNTLRADKEIPEVVQVSLKGEYSRMQESFSSLARGLALASILVYLIMVPLFRSFAGPLVIMFTVPLGIIGVLVTLFLTGTTLNVQSEMGVIFLVGIVVANGVLMVDFANKLRNEGMPVREAAIRAAATRFRPILMTFLATSLDLFPLALGLGQGNETITPLARAVVGGLITATGLTLFVVPALYSLFIRDRAGPAFNLHAALTAPHHAEDGLS